MNKNQMHQIFAHYIDNFEKLNDLDHAEYYKWQICYKFRILMDEAQQQMQMISRMRYIW